MLEEYSKHGENENIFELECLKAILNALTQKMQENLGVIGKENGEMLMAVYEEMD